MSAEINSESKEQFKRGNVELIRQKLMAMGADWEGQFEIFEGRSNSYSQLIISSKTNPFEL